MTGPEATGLVSAIGYVQAVAAAHAAHGADEGFISSLAAAQYGRPVVDAVAAARQGSTDAAAAWTAAAAELGAALIVRDAYMAAPDAGTKRHLTSDDAGPSPESSPAAASVPIGVPTSVATTDRSAEMNDTADEETMTAPDLTEIGRLARNGFAGPPRNAGGTRPASANPQQDEPRQDAPDTPLTLKRLQTGRGVVVTWENGRRVESGTPVEIGYDPDTGTAYEFDADGQPHELRADQPGAIGAQLLHMHSKIRTDPDHGVTTEQARTLLAGLTADQLKTVCIEIGYPADSRTRTKNALVDHIVRTSVGSLLDSYALYPHRRRPVVSKATASGDGR